ncbi:hypothetical protein [Burkholderia phage FLC6]|nr:hypothetical protein [Burkholderia phage FLC6]BDD79385.1 hypothetical protein [Burkholderia phage FLC8]
MLHKQQVLDKLSEFCWHMKLERNQIQVLGGSAMVMRGLRDLTADIDLYVPTEVCRRMVTTGVYYKLPVKGKPDVMWVVGGVIDARDTKHECDRIINGYHVQSLKSLLELKLPLNRKKDEKDIQVLREAMTRE